MLLEVAVAELMDLLKASLDMKRAMAATVAEVKAEKHKVPQAIIIWH
jgi:hypothetical protein